MSMKRKSILSTPSSKSVHSAFKSPFRSPGLSSGDSNIDSTLKTGSDANLGPYPIQSKISVVGNLDQPITPNHCLQPKTQLSRKFKKVPGGFKSPIVNREVTAKRLNEGGSPALKKFSNPLAARPHLKNGSVVPPEEELKYLLEKEKELDEEIEVLENQGYRVSELQSHIKKLHKYNDLKDTAQVIFGHLAELEQVSLKSIHIKYGVNNID